MGDQESAEKIMAKFGQNLGARLVRTFPRSLAEASPSDTVFGIGLASSDPRAQGPCDWRGANLLGRCLERTRGELICEGASASQGT